MSEPKIVRLVRCPKCQNLLPELADYEVYQCGGCGAVLRAKVKEQEAEVLADRSDEEKLGVFSKSDGLSGKGMQQTLESLSENEVAGRNVSDMDVESDCIAFKAKENFGGKTDKYLKSQSVKINDSGTKTDPNVSASELGNVEVEQLLNYFGDVSLTQRSEDIPNWQGEMSEHCGLPKGENEGGRSLNYKNYQDEGPSNYFSDTSYGNNAKPGKDTDGFNMPKRIGSLQKDRAELLHMMEELRYKLRRSGNLGVNIREKNPIDQNAAHQGPNRSSTSGMFNKNAAAQDTDMQHGFMPDKPLNSPYYYSHHHPQYPHAGRQGMGVSNPHLFPYGHNDMPGYGNYIESRIMGGPFLTPSHCEHQVPHLPYVHRQAFAPYPTRCAPSSTNGLLHPSVCGCYSDHYRVPQPDYPDGTRFCDTHNNPMVYPRNIPGPPQPGFNLKSSGTSSSLHGPSARTRLDDDMTCYTHGFVRQRKQKEALAKGRRYCQPIASGAPFIICRSCSKLLQLPKRTFSITSKRQKLCCGACSTVMDCALINKKFTVSGETKKLVKETSPCLDKVTDEGISSEILRWEDKTNSVTDDFDSSNHECQAVNGKPPVLTNGLDLTSNETQGSQSLPRSSPASFEGMEFSGVASPNGSPVQDQLGHSFNANVTSRVWKGSQSTRSDHDKVIIKDRISRQNSLNETSSTAQIEEVSFNVYSKAQVSEKSDPETQRNDPVRTNKGSSFAGVIKKRLKGLSRSNHSADSREGNITINGCKIPDRLVKKAEKLAGPIQPGNYWYDFRAGFWGVIGGPCLGIIPPFIEEFNCPMLANCSSGATGVFVNGRELQQIDLDLLACRGLPTARGRSYVIEISGKVFDKDSGEVLDGLGKLAPTIEKVKHGFGMKPRTQK
ncbi:unnamed protein product [Rhodiola kirilowii]